MIRRLIQQQHIGVRHQRLRQRDAFLGAARQRVHPRRAVQMQALQGLLDALFPHPAVEVFDARLQRVEVVARQVLLVALAQFAGLGRAFAGGLEDGGLGLEDGLLRHVGAAQPLLELQHAVVGLVQPSQDFQQRGFAGAVAPDQRHALAAVERETGAIEQRHMAEGEVGVGKGDQGHRGIVGDARRDAGANCAADGAAPPPAANLSRTPHNETRSAA